MKNILLLCISAFLISCSPSTVNIIVRDVGKPNFLGKDWIDASETSKAAYLFGVLDGAKQMYNTTDDIFKKQWNKISMSQKKLQSGVGADYFEEVPKIMNDLSQYYKENNSAYINVFGVVEIKQYMFGLDSLYKNFRNLKIPVAIGMYIVNLQVSGKKDDEINPVIEYFRELSSGIDRKD